MGLGQKTLKQVNWGVVSKYLDSNIEETNVKSTKHAINICFVSKRFECQNYQPE